jgi:hypothetical protein
VKELWNKSISWAFDLSQASPGNEERFPSAPSVLHNFTLVFTVHVLLHRDEHAYGPSPHPDSRTHPFSSTHGQTLVWTREHQEHRQQLGLAVSQASARSVCRCIDRARHITQHTHCCCE